MLVDTRLLQNSFYRCYAVLTGTLRNWRSEAITSGHCCPPSSFYCGFVTP